jgi:hypothetical protein
MDIAGSKTALASNEPDRWQPHGLMILEVWCLFEERVENFIWQTAWLRQIRTADMRTERSEFAANCTLRPSLQLFPGQAAVMNGCHPIS